MALDLALCGTAALRVVMSPRVAWWCVEGEYAASDRRAAVGDERRERSVAEAALRQGALIAFDETRKDAMSIARGWGQTHASVVIETIKRGDKSYVGIGAKRRCGWHFEKSRTGRMVVMPNNLSQSEITRALRQHPVVQDAHRSDGRVALSTSLVKDLILDEKLEIIVSPQTDPNPGVCDRAEKTAQATVKNPSVGGACTERLIGAGTVVRADGLVEPDGYALFAWVVRASVFESGRLRCATVKQSPLDHATTLTTAPSEVLEELSARARERLSNQDRRRVDVDIAALGSATEAQRVRDNGKASFWCSKAEGAVRTRSWGGEGNTHPSRMVWDLGEGGEEAAMSLHLREAKKKLFPAPARLRDSGIYVIAPRA